MVKGGGPSEPPPFGLIAGLGELGDAGGGKSADHRDPGALGRLPSALILASGVGPVDELIAVGRRAADGDGQGGIAGRLEAHGDFAEVEVDVGNNFSGLGGNRAQAEGVGAGGDQIGRQDLIGAGVIGLVQLSLIHI